MGVIWGTQSITLVNALECGNCGAAVPRRNATQHENFHRTFSNRIGQDMSKVLWCDNGDHAFKAGQPGSITFNGSMVNEKGITEDTAIDACSEHNPFRKVPDVQTMLTAEGDVVTNPYM